MSDLVEGESLEEISSRGDLFLDTCVLMVPLDLRAKDGFSTATDRELAQQSLDYFLRFARDENSGLFITKDVKHEYERSNGVSPSKKACLFRVLRAKGGIIDSVYFSDFNRMRSSYGSLKIRYGLSETDFNLSIAGNIWGKDNGSCILISNDENLLRVAKKISLNEGISQEKLSGLSRVSFNTYRDIYFN